MSSFLCYLSIEIDDSGHFRFFGEQNDDYHVKERKILALEGYNKIFFRWKKQKWQGGIY